MICFKTVQYFNINLFWFFVLSVSIKISFWHFSNVHLFKKNLLNNMIKPKKHIISGTPRFYCIKFFKGSSVYSIPITNDGSNIFTSIFDCIKIKFICSNIRFKSNSYTRNISDKNLGPPDNASIIKDVVYLLFFQNVFYHDIAMLSLHKFYLIVEHKFFFLCN